MKHLISKIYLTIAIMLVAVLLPLSASANQNMSFDQWVASFRQTALQNGITEKTFNRAFAGVHSADQSVLRKAAYQPEFVDPVWNYFDNRINNHIINLGRQNAKKWSGWLTKIERTYGVDRNILLAIWSMESGYGAILKRDSVMMDAIRSLATLAYADPKRGRYARGQLIAAMKILQSGDIDRSHLSGSWAGALGHTQFIPTSYLAYAVDIDGDGRRDIWNSVPDALASAASLLAKNGWQRNKQWGYEVTLPNNGRKFPVGNLTFPQWQNLGVRPAKGVRLPSHGNAVLKAPDGRKGPVFLVTRNFFVIKRYNNSDRYALAVGILADEIAGRASLQQDWNRPFSPTTSSEKAEIQKHLKRLGLYDGNIDSKIGSGTRKGIAIFQKRNNMEPTGFPSKEVLLKMRRTK